MVCGLRLPWTPAVVGALSPRARGADGLQGDLTPVSGDRRWEGLRDFPVLHSGTSSPFSRRSTAAAGVV